jgi:hypothetical protein
MTVPDWLARRGGTLQQAVDGHSWAVVFDGGPQYLLRPTPAGGEVACAVTQTINGRRLDKGGKYPSEEDAVRGGLEDLRQALGW